jgi:hypothetical protein
MGWLESPSANIFVILEALPGFVEGLRLSAQVAEPWFLAIFVQVKNDLANGPFFEALATYSRCWPEEALSLLERNLSALDSDRIAIIGSVLAGLYAVSLLDDMTRRRDTFEASLRASRDISKGAAAYLAYRCRFIAGNATHEDLQRWFEELSLEAPELRIEGFALARVVATLKCNDDVALGIALKWLSDHTRGDLDEVAKYQVITVAETLLAPRKKDVASKTQDALALIRKILPLPTGESGLWNAIRSLFFGLVHRNPAAMPDVLHVLVSDGGTGLTAALTRGELAPALSDWLRSADGAATVLNLCFSRTGAERQLGLALFERGGIAEFPPDKLAMVEEASVLRGLYQSQLTPFMSDVVSRYLLALLPRVETCGETVQQEYYEELLYQAESLPRGCLEVLRQHLNPIEALQKVIQRADEYAEALRACSQSPIGQMAVPNLRGALRIQSRRVSRSMNEGFKRGSTLLSLFHNITVLYGQSFSRYEDGHLSDPTAMGEIKHEWEVPRFLLMDPEAAAMRRLQASTRLKELEDVS